MQGAPIKDQLITANGLINQVWAKWFAKAAAAIPTTGNFTVTPNAASTVVVDRAVKTNSVITFHPTTATAGIDFASGSMYIVCAEGSFTVNHANNAAVNRVFNYSVTQL